ncbi:MAG: threonine-phosphate decarboxylase [Anaerospora sp.]|jgi:threonine-phosphate decarboxylase|nr:threonine-phosphate decarboxylase [Anaerospora sp.]
MGNGSSLLKKLFNGNGDKNEVMNTEDIIDLSVNTNPLGMPKSAKLAITREMELYAQYPDPKCTALSERIAQHYSGISAKQVLCVSGVDDAIYRIIAAQQPRKALILAPTYEDYEGALRNAGCAVTYHFLQKEEKYQTTETILDSLTHDIDMFFLCNPNNPTGQVIERKLLNQIVDKCQENGTILVVDESFIGFLDKPEEYTGKGLIHAYTNLIILDGFTKLYAMPGLRLGFCISNNEELLGKIFAAGQPWNVSTPAQVAGIAALKDKKYLKETQEVILTEKKWLLNELSKLKIEVWGSCANYLFFPAPFPNTRKLLREDNILLRNCENFVGLNGEFCRIAIRTHHENEEFIAAIRRHVISGEH